MMFPLVRNSPIARAINSFEGRFSEPSDCTFPLPSIRIPFGVTLRLMWVATWFYSVRLGETLTTSSLVERSVSVGYVAELIGLLFLPTFDVEDEQKMSSPEDKCFTMNRVTTLIAERQGYVSFHAMLQMRRSFLPSMM